MNLAGAKSCPRLFPLHVFLPVTPALWFLHKSGTRRKVRGRIRRSTPPASFMLATSRSVEAGAKRFGVLYFLKLISKKVTALAGGRVKIIKARGE